MARRSALRRFEQIHRWRKAADWAPMLWLPLMIYCLSTGRLALGMALGLSGFLFAVLTRAVVWLRRCPDCGETFGESAAAFEAIWSESRCLGCGISLFGLRRADGRRRRPKAA